MLGQDIPAICCANKGGNVTANPSTSLMVAPTSKTIAARDVPFPMVDPFAPVVEAGAPVTGLDAWPYRRGLGNRYYGLGKLSGTWDELASVFPNPITTITSQGVTLPSTPSKLQTILASITQGLATIPAIISAGKQQPYYNPAQLTQQQTLYGQPIQTTGQPITSIGAQTGAALGNLGDTFGQIVAQHPYLVMGGGLALLLMFMKPPGRR